MAYTTIAALQQRLGSAVYARLTDRVSGATADDAVAQQLLDEAEAELEGYLSVRYVTPVDVSQSAAVAALLEARVLDLAEVHAWDGSPFVSDPPQRVKELRRAVLGWLTSVAAGELHVPDAEAREAPGAAVQTPLFASQPRTWSADEADGL